jgi:M6 family metalloprotease-like protein
MKKKLFFVASLLMFIVQVAFQNKAFAVPADPRPIKFRQPDGSVVTITLKGDEKIHWAETIDGYTLLSNGKKGWEYAIVNRNGDIECSKILAHEKDKRVVKENKLLRKIPQKLTFSKNQVQILKQIWNIKQSNNTLKSTSMFNSSGISKVFSPLGSKNLVMILIGFTDQAFTKTHDDFDNLMNQSGYNLDGAEGSVKDYFLETSYNNFEITTTVAGPYTSSHDMAYYGANDENGDDVNAKALITEAITLANPDVNYANFDNDGDGTVDGVYVVYAGYGEATSGIDNTIWPHAGSIPILNYDGVAISKYSCSNELTAGTSDITTIGVICHEFGHVCGAKDYYDTDYATSGQYDGTGYWDVMATGVYDGALSGSKPAHFNPYEKIRAGWATSKLLNSAASITISDIAASPDIYRYNTTTSNEYFLLENRQQTGFNTYVPGHGLMIYHVDGDYISSHTSSNDINVDSHQGMYPMAANSTTENGVMIHSTSTINTDGCPWTGTTLVPKEFTDITTPSTKSWAGNNTNADLTHIEENSGVILLSFKGGATINPILVFNAVGSSANQINLSWTKNAANNDVIIAVNTTNTFGALSNGTTYNVNDAISGGGTVIYKGSASSFNHTGLTSSTSYYYHIWSMSSTPNYSEALASYSQTLCNSVTSLPYRQGFEDAIIPDCWTQEYVSGTSDWAFQEGGYDGSGGYPSSAHSGTGNACLYVGSWTPSVTKLISPPIDLTGSPSPVLKFWHTQQSWSGRIDILRVFYRTSATGTWTQLAIYTTDTPSWTIESIDLPNTSSTYYIAFEATTNYGFGVCIDDVEIRTSDCFAGTWTGEVNSDWFTSANWCGSGVPAATTNVIIPSGTPYNPSIDGNDAYCNSITIENGATLSMSGSLQYILNVSGDWTNNGNFSAGIGKVRFDGTNDLQLISGSSETAFNILRVSKGARDRILEATSSIRLTSSSTNPLELSSGTFKLSSNSSITPFTTNGYSLASTCGLWNNGGTVNLPSTVYINGLLQNTGGIINAYYLIYSGTLSSFHIEGGTLNVSSRFYPSTAASDVTAYTQTGGTVNITTVSSSSTTVAPFDLRSGSSFTMTGGTIAFQKASSFASGEYYNQAGTNSVTGGTIQIGTGSTSGSPVIRINTSVPIYNLTVNGTGTPTAKLLSNLTVLNSVTINSTLDASNLSITLGGNWINNGTFTSGTGTVTFSGSSTQEIDGTAITAYNNLTLNNSAGLLLSGNVNTKINSVLTLNSGVLSTGNNCVVIPASGSVSRNSGHIYGNLQKNFATGSNVSRTFEVGDASSLNFTPVNLTIASVSTAGNIIAKTVSGDHPNMGSSHLDNNKSVNRYWTITNNGVVFTTFDGVFNFISSDMDVEANDKTLVCGKYSSGWDYPSIGARTSTSTQITGASSFGDFQLAESSTCGTLTLPFTEAFDGTTIPGCWGSFDYQGNGQNWKFGTTTSFGDGTPNLTEGNYAFLNSYANGVGNTQNADLITPTIDMSGFSLVNIQFDYFHQYWSGTDASASLSYSVDDGLTWTPIHQWTSTSANPATFNQDVPAIAGQSHVKIKWNYSATYGGGWAIDNISVTGTPIVTSDLNLSGKTVESGETTCFDAQNIITVAGSSPVVFSNGSVETLIAGKSIFFMPGFIAQQGSSMDAYITTDATFCDDLSASPLVEKSTSIQIAGPDIKEISSNDKAIKVYPNPCNGRITLELVNFNGLSTVSIINTSGTVIQKTEIFNDKSKNFDLTRFNAGIYFVSVKNGEEVKTSKIIVK